VNGRKGWRGAARAGTAEKRFFPGIDSRISRNRRGKKKVRIRKLSRGRGPNALETATLHEHDRGIKRGQQVQGVNALVNPPEERDKREGGNDSMI